jgi:hypothetical protein
MRSPSEPRNPLEVVEEALAAIANHYPELDPGGKYQAELDALKPEIADCSECRQAKKSAWPPSALCNGHYSKWYGVLDRRDRDQAIRKWSEPQDIARAALALVRKMRADAVVGWVERDAATWRFYGETWPSGARYIPDPEVDRPALLLPLPDSTEVDDE